MKRTPRDATGAALAVRRETCMMGIPVPVHAIAEALVDLLEERPLSDLRDGMVVQHDGMTAITVNARLTSRGRKRFTVGHELGHVRLHGGTFECLSRDVGSPAARDPREKEANAFAAELLMPEDEFRKALGGYGPDLESVAELAGRDAFDVSRRAAALRAVQVTDHQCVLVVSREGRIEWTATSAMLPLWTRREGPVPPRSATSRVVSAPLGAVEEEEADASAWLDDRRVQPGRLWFDEEAMALGEGWVATLLTPDREVDVDALEAGGCVGRDQ